MTSSHKVGSLKKKKILNRIGELCVKLTTKIQINKIKDKKGKNYNRFQ